MPAKSAPSTSPQAAQNRVWKLELKSLAAASRKVARDFAQARKPLAKAYFAASRKLDAFDKREAKLRPRALAQITRRIAILNGRLGL